MATARFCVPPNSPATSRSRCSESISAEIGFLAEAEADNIDAVLEHVVSRDYRVEERMTLDVVVRVEGRIINRGWALNEASLEKGPRLGVLGAVLEVDGRPVSSFGCDGVLVSTPTGSTA